MCNGTCNELHTCVMGRVMACVTQSHEYIFRKVSRETGARGGLSRRATNDTLHCKTPARNYTLKNKRGSKGGGNGGGVGGGRWGERCRPVGRWRTAAGGGAGGIQRLRRLRRRQWGRRRRTRRWWRRWGREGVRGARRINLRAKINHKVSHGEQGWCDAGGAATGGRQTSRARSRACAACPQGDARQRSSRRETTARAGRGVGSAHKGTWASSGGERGVSRQHAPI